MGSGISLSQEQIVNIIKRDLNKEFIETIYKKDLNRYTTDGMEIFYDFTDEEELTKKIKCIDNFIKNKIRR